MTETKYFKITNAEENHNGFQYVDGLNVLDKPFEVEGSCVPGGLYFSNAKHILEFLSYGIYLREITLSVNDPDFKMVELRGKKWRANKIILGQRRNLSERSTWEYLFSLGALHKVDDSIAWASKHGFLDIIKILTEKEASFEHNINRILDDSLKFGRLEIIEFLIDRKIGTNKKKSVYIYYEYIVTEATKYGHANIVGTYIDKCIIPRYNEVLVKAVQFGHLEIVKLLIDEGAASVSFDYDYPIRLASREGHLEIVKYLIEKGANLKTFHNYAVRWASYFGYLEVVKYLIENGADFKDGDNEALRWARQNNQFDVVEFLTQMNSSESAQQIPKKLWFFEKILINLFSPQPMVNKPK